MFLAMKAAKQIDEDNENKHKHKAAVWVGDARGERDKSNICCGHLVSYPPLEARYTIVSFRQIEQGTQCY